MGHRLALRQGFVVMESGEVAGVRGDEDGCEEAKIGADEDQRRQEQREGSGEHGDGDTYCHDSSRGGQRREARAEPGGGTDAGEKSTEVEREGSQPAAPRGERHRPGEGAGVRARSRGPSGIEQNCGDPAEQIDAEADCKLGKIDALARNGAMEQKQVCFAPEVAEGMPEAECQGQCARREVDVAAERFAVGNEGNDAVTAIAEQTREGAVSHRIESHVEEPGQAGEGDRERFAEFFVEEGAGHDSAPKQSVRFHATYTGRRSSWCFSMVRRGRLRRVPRVYSIKASSRLRSRTSMLAGSSDSMSCSWRWLYPTMTTSRRLPTRHVLTRPSQAGNAGGWPLNSRMTLRSD